MCAGSWVSPKSPINLSWSPVGYPRAHARCDGAWPFSAARDRGLGWLCDLQVFAFHQQGFAIKIEYRVVALLKSGDDMVNNFIGDIVARSVADLQMKGYIQTRELIEKDGFVILAFIDVLQFYQ